MKKNTVQAILVLSFFTTFIGGFIMLGVVLNKGQKTGMIVFLVWVANMFFMLYMASWLDTINKRENEFDEYKINIGKKTHKTSKEGRQPNPFKSGFKVNTIKGVIEHPQLKIAAYTFEEDESYVECRRCVIIESDKKQES